MESLSRRIIKHSRKDFASIGAHYAHRTAHTRSLQWSLSPSLDFGDAGIVAERVGDVDANAIGGVGREIDGPLDQVVAADRPQDDPSRAVPALHGEVSQSPLGECHGVGLFVWITRIILQC